MIHYKILRLSGVHYPSVLDSLTDTFPDFMESSYQKQLDYIFRHKAMYSDSFSNSMRKLGHKSYEIIWDLEVLQKRWAKEHSICFSKEAWMLDILLAQINEIRPDVIYFQGTELCIPGRLSGASVDVNLATIIKEKFTFIRVVTMFSGFPSLVSRVKDVDILFAGTPAIVDHYRRAGVKSTLCYHAFDEDLLASLTVSDLDWYDVTFVGSTQAPGERYWMLRDLLVRTPIQLWIDSAEEKRARKSFFNQEWQKLEQALWGKARGWLRNFLEILGHKMLQKIAQVEHLPSPVRNLIHEIVRGGERSNTVSQWGGLMTTRRLPRQTLSERFPDRCKPPVIGLDYHRILMSSRITFNKHVDRSMGAVGNLRLFEATGLGSCLLTDTGTNLRDLFEPDHEIVTYDTIGEAVEKINYLLDNEQERKAIAEAGQRKTLNSHTVFCRCQLIDEVIRPKL